MVKEQTLKMKEADDLVIFIFTNCNRREPKQCPFALVTENTCWEKNN